ncbi:lantibiotic dehydratase C-terminal domain-containing protein [Pseudalkalibacillus sp. JSM 102089]|uniref:lantibiotic dehydratase C-terminal domain-containing protein n=1 Tax=Pseudalkalibacillus sp. JSM 102089 TaxID=3229856 RepID=UPI003524E6D9
MWVSYKIFYHQSYKDALILNGIIPVMKRLKMEKFIHSYYFDRHWENGPHIQLNMYLKDSHFKNEVETIFEKQIDLYLEDNPSEKVNLDKLQRNMNELYKMEMIAQKEDSIFKNNSYIKSDYDIHSNLGEKGKKFIEKYFVNTSELVVSLIEKTIDDKSKRYMYLMNIMVALLHSLGDPKRTYLSYRSHSESILHAYDTSGKIREKFEANYINNKDTIQNILEKAENSEIDNEASKWKKFFLEFNEEIKSEVAKGNLNPIDIKDAEAFYLENGVPEHWVVDELSSFHQMFYSQDGINELLQSNYFRSIRMSFSFLYMTFRQLGLTTLERIYLCYLIANGVEEFYSIDWKQQLLESQNKGHMYVD